MVKALNETICFGNSALSRVQEEAIATVIAVANQCRYNALTHGGFLLRHSGDPELASHLLYDYTRADLDPRTRRMLDFAVRLTREPGSSSAQDLEGLRRAGFDQEAIVSIVLITCLFNFMNRLATSFGVEVPPSYRKVVVSWLSGPAVQEGWLFPPVEVQSYQSAAHRLGLDVTGGQQKPAGQGPLQQDQQNTGPNPAPGNQPDAERSDSDRDRPGAGQKPSAGDQQGPREVTQSVERFISVCCTVGTSESTTARDLHISYLRWCDDNCSASTTFAGSVNYSCRFTSRS